MKALSILDEVIAAIRASKDKRHAKDNLMKKFQFSEIQAEAIVSLQLYRLSNTDITALQKEAEELSKAVTELTAILDDEKKLTAVIKKELKDVQKRFKDNRRTLIEAEIQEIKINLDVLIACEDVIVTVTKEGYVKRTSLRSHAASNGQDPGMKDSDRLLTILEMNTIDVLLLFTNKGNYLYCPVHKLPDVRWKDMGQHIANIIPIGYDESIVKVIPVTDFEKEAYLLFITKNGWVKKTELKHYKAKRNSKALTAINLKDEDSLVDVHETDGKMELFLTTYNGYGLRFKENEVSMVGVRAAGLKGIHLQDGDYITNGHVIREGDHQRIVIGTQRGAVKKMKLDKIECTSLGTQGEGMLRELKANPHRVIGSVLVKGEETIFIQSKKGQIESFKGIGIKI